MTYSDSELLELAAIHGRAPKDQRQRQADVIAEFVRTESQPSCALVRMKQMRRWQAARAAVRERMLLTGTA